MSFDLDRGGSRVVDRVVAADVDLLVQMAVRSHHEMRILAVSFHPRPLLQEVAYTPQRQVLELRADVARVGNDQQVVPAGGQPHQHRLGAVVALHRVAVEVDDLVDRGRGRRVHPVRAPIEEQHQIVDARFVVLPGLVAVAVLSPGGVRTGERSLGIRTMERQAEVVHLCRLLTTVVPFHPVLSRTTGRQKAAGRTGIYQ